MTRKALRERQRKEILNLIRKEQHVSKADIFRLLHIRPATLDVLIADLEKKGLVRGNGRVIPTENRGRKPIAVELNAKSRVSIGVHLSEISIHSAAIDLKGNIMAESKEELNGIANEKDLFNKLSASINSLLDIIKIKKDRILSICLGIPGSMDFEKGISLSYYFYPWWRKINFKAKLEKEFGINVVLENDTRASALAEQRYGLGRNVENFLFLDVGITGIGLGIILNNRLYLGRSGKSGESGHITIDENGPLCSCGNRGCMEALCSGMALEKEAKRLVNEGVITPLKEEKEIRYCKIFEYARQKDKVSLQIVENAGKHLGVGAANLINTFNPELLILGGYLSREGGDLLLAEVERTVRVRALPELRNEASIKISSIGENGGALGTATAVLDKFFMEERK